MLIIERQTYYTTMIPKQLREMQIKFSRVGIHTLFSPQKVRWMVKARLYYTDGSKADVFLEKFPWIETGEKKLIGAALASNGFVVTTPAEPRVHHFYTPEGEHVAELPEREVGTLVQIDDNTLVFRHSNHLRFYTITAHPLGERELTDAEKQTI